MSSTNELHWLPRFKRDYYKLSHQVRKKINNALTRMEIDLQYPSLCVKKIKGTIDIWEARASDSLRITFTLKNNQIYLRTAGEHDTLKNP